MTHARTSTDIHADSRHNGHDIEFLHNIADALEGTTGHARTVIAHGTHPEVAAAARDVMNSHGTQLARVRGLARSLGSSDGGGGGSSGGHGNGNAYGNGPRSANHAGERRAGRNAPRPRAQVGMCTRAFDFETRTQGGDGRTLEGYAAVFNSPTRIRDLQGDFDEKILPGAFKRSLERRTPVLQFDHGKDPRIGSTPIGKIEALAEDSHGLHVRARLFAHPDVDRVREAIAEGAVSGMSFRFGVPKGGDKWTSRSGDVDLREIREADTHELGPVVFPAYDATSVSVRSILAGLSADEMRELVHELESLFGLAVDLQDLTEQPSARSAGGGDSGARPGSGDAPALSLSERFTADGESLRLRGIIK
jgi:HK97 family phage prohead protease